MAPTPTLPPPPPPPPQTQATEPHNPSAHTHDGLLEQVALASVAGFGATSPTKEYHPLDAAPAASSTEHQQEAILRQPELANARATQTKTGLVAGYARPNDAGVFSRLAALATSDAHSEAADDTRGQGFAQSQQSQSQSAETVVAAPPVLDESSPKKHNVLDHLGLGLDHHDHDDNSAPTAAAHPNSPRVPVSPIASPPSPTHVRHNVLDELGLGLDHHDHGGGADVPVLPEPRSLLNRVAFEHAGHLPAKHGVLEELRKDGLVSAEGPPRDGVLAEVLREEENAS
ncbi:hypothetical protein HMN09_00019500 [Mycena chlorophos]|uniref:Uncharacterized protein n=1 Tax=Mycena chlorophos TaxID=658473 RepID=A0A8H6TNQ5_MYCCL|nr:hypothetical protein HMN09_00019500 [Mycena chlorophos]